MPLTLPFLQLVHKIIFIHNILAGSHVKYTDQFRIQLIYSALNSLRSQGISTLSMILLSTSNEDHLMVQLRYSKLLDWTKGIIQY